MMGEGRVFSDLGWTRDSVLCGCVVTVCTGTLGICDLGQRRGVRGSWC